MHSHAPLTNYNLENPSLKHEINIHKTVQSYKINISIDTFFNYIVCTGRKYV